MFLSKLYYNMKLYNHHIAFFDVKKLRANDTFFNVARSPC